MPWIKCYLVAWAICLAIVDYRQRRLPNGITLGGAAAGIGYLLIHGSSLLGAAPLSALAAGLGAVVVLLPFYGFGWLGAGDIKLMAAIGFIGGFQVLLTTFILSSLLTLPLALWLLVGKRFRGERVLSRPRLPQGVFLAMGFILSLVGAMRPGLE